jgi:SlyX protein
MDQELIERLERLETHVAHLERQADELNKVVLEQDKSIQKLRAQQQRLAESVGNAELERVRSTNPKPPHYQ